jgi:competence ComEA-like helix-hairpin-helix protein
MAKVSLRNYNREIESLIDHDRLEEAIAHCRYILQSYPKHLETYRLLGKAYLESKRYPEAADIFQRVLMAAPDDFVSHVGMSIIRDNQGRLDESIRYMEGAFEVQPSNAAIQAELQRLYGRRDGVQPPKIRLTRGALAHMYMQGELYPQAIGEIRGVLSEDPRRVDMQVLLALAYYRSGQRVESSEVCTKLLDRYPYCLEANRLLAAILPGTEGAEGANLFRDRLQELDPYTAFVTGSIFLASNVPDMAISLERLAWSSGQKVEMRPEWASSLGIPLGEEVSLEKVPSEQPEEVPSAADNQEGESEPPSKPSSISSQETPQGESLIPDWLREAGWSEATSEAPQETPITEQGGEEELAPAEIPDWVQSMAPKEAETGSEPEGLPESGEPALEKAQIPDWLKSAAPEQLQPSQEASFSVENEALQGESVPSTEAPGDENFKDELGTSAKDQNAALAWLESLAAKRGAKSEELMTTPEERSETPPDWVLQEQTKGEESQPEPSRAEEPLSDVDRTGLWLRELAEKDQSEGGEPAEPSNAPAEQVEGEGELLGQGDVPDWLKEAAPAPSEPPVEVAPSEEDLPGWLRGFVGEEQQAQPAEAPLAEETPVAEKLDLNTATQKQLAELPGIGELLAGSILAYRQANGDFQSLEDLRKVSGISESTIDDLRGLVSISGAQSPVMQGEPPDLSKWLEEEVQAPETTQPTTPTEWQPLEEEQAASEAPAPGQAEQGLESVSIETSEAAAAESEPASQQSPQVDPMLAQAQADLREGQVSIALESYGKLIKKGRQLKEVIDDLRQGLDRYPAEVPVWQMLGDAYLRANRLQDALDAYTRAEELLR